MAHNVIASQPPDANYPLPASKWKVGGNSGKGIDVRNAFYCNHAVTARQIARLAYGYNFSDLGISPANSCMFVNYSSSGDISDLINNDQGASLTGGPSFLTQMLARHLGRQRQACACAAPVSMGS